MNNPIGTLTPAYGRDYKSKAAVIADFEAGKDFYLVGFAGSGYVNRNNYPAKGNITVRYAKQRKVTIIAWKGDVKAAFNPSNK